MMRIIAGLALVILATLAAAAWLNRGEIALALVARQAPAMMAANALEDLPEQGLTIILCGTGGPMPSETRGAPCAAVYAGGRLFVIDAGDGAASRLAFMNIPRSAIDAVLLTHFHSDHIDGLGALALQRWAQGGSSAPLPLYGPPGVERIAAGFAEVYAQDAAYRVAHHGPETVPPQGHGFEARPFAAPQPGAATVVLDDAGLKITAFAVAHDPVEPAVGYRFDYAGRSVVISGDTAKSSELVRVAKGADVIVHDALSPRLVAMLGEAARETGQTGLAKIMADIPSYHASPEEAAEAAAEAGAGLLVLTHLVPPPPMRALEPIFLGEAPQRFDGEVLIGRDGDAFILTPGTAAPQKRNLMR